MAKRWTIEEDDFLVRYYPAVGDYCGTHDLGRPSGAADRRVAFLRQCGAWDALRERHQADYTHLRSYLVAVGASNAVLTDLDMLHPGAPEDSGPKGFLNDMLVDGGANG